MSGVPGIDVGALFGPPGPERQATDAAIFAAAGSIGFLSIAGLPAAVPLGAAARSELLRIFDLPEHAQHALWRRKFEPRNPNVYRGWFPLQPGNLTHKEGIDLGADVLYGPELVRGDDPLLEATPLPAEAALPGWRAAVAAYYAAMEQVCAVLMRSIARSLRLEQSFFDGSFRRGLSTLRLLRYPARTPQELLGCEDSAVWVSHAGALRYLTGAPHTDSGFMTLLAQDGVPGLQVRSRQGDWIDLAPAEGALAVNFGQVLERWCAGRLKATEHRVLGSGRERHSIAFFYEARADAQIAPLPLQPAAEFEPFYYGDYLWSRIVNFIEFRGMNLERAPLRFRPCESRDK